MFAKHATLNKSCGEKEQRGKKSGIEACEKPITKTCTSKREWQVKGTASAMPLFASTVRQRMIITRWTGGGGGGGTTTTGGCVTITRRVTTGCATIGGDTKWDES